MPIVVSAALAASTIACIFSAIESGSLLTVILASVTSAVAVKVTPGMTSLKVLLGLLTV